MPIKKQIIACLETIVITVLFLALSVYQGDPFSMKSAFPWIWFAPVLIALRYGLLFSIFCLFIFIVAFYYIPIPNEDPIDATFMFNERQRLFCFCGLFLTIFCASFRDHWQKKNKQISEISDYLQQRIQSIAQSHQVLSMSYERLENQYIISPVTTRSSLEELRGLLANSADVLPNQKPIFERLLNILSQQCSLETAAIFSVLDFQIDAAPLASIGQIKPPHNDDFLIQACFERGEIAYVSAQMAEKRGISDYLVVAPFWNQAHQLQAVLLIQDMPFLSLNEDNLAVMHLLINYFNSGYAIHEAKQIRKAYPDCPTEFSNELHRLIQLQKTIGQDSALIAYAFLPDTLQDNALFRVSQEKRGLDSLWLSDKGAIKTILLLMPLTRQAGVEYYRTRMNTLLEREFSAQLNQSFIRFRAYFLSDFADSVTAIKTVHHFQEQS